MEAAVASALVMSLLFLLRLFPSTVTLSTGGCGRGLAVITLNYQTKKIQTGFHQMEC